MVINVERCVGCHACVLACKLENKTFKGIFWRRVLETEVGKYPNAKKVWVPILCNHCEEAVCVKACPTKASTKRPDGIVTIDANKCAGCRYCMMACPYEVRNYLRKIEYYYGDAHGILLEKPLL